MCCTFYSELPMNKSYLTHNLKEVSVDPMIEADSFVRGQPLRGETDRQIDNYNHKLHTKLKADRPHPRD